MRDMTISELERLDAGAADTKDTFQMDEDAFRLFYERTARPVWAYLSRMCGDARLADDLLQETYYRFLRANASHETDAHRRNYLFRIATNLVKDLRRRPREAQTAAAANDEPVDRLDPQSAECRQRSRPPARSGALDGAPEAARARPAVARLRAGLVAQGNRQGCWA